MKPQLPRMFRRNSLKTRILLLVLLTFLISIGTLMLYARHSLRTDAQKLLGEQQALTTSVAAVGVDHELQSRLTWLQDVALLATDSMLAGPSALQHFLDQRIGLKSHFNAGILVTGLRGETLATVPPRLREQDGPNQHLQDAFMRVMQEDSPRVSLLLSGPEGSAAEIAFIVPLHDRQGYVVGTLAGKATLDKLNFTAALSTNQPGATLQLLDPQQRWVMAATLPAQARRPLATTEADPLMSRLLAGSESYGVSDRQLIAARTIPSSGWVVLSSLSNEQAFAPILNVTRPLLLATGLLILLFGALLRAMLKRLLAPLTQASNALENTLHSDQPPEPLAIVCHDELGKLIDGFNRLQERLLQRESHFRQMMEASNAAIFLMNRERVITYANPRTAEMFGLPLAQLMGCHYALLVHAADTQDSDSKTRLALDDEGGTFLADYERRYRRSDGSEFWGRLNGRSMFDAQGKKVGLLTVLIDISDSKRQEQKLQLAASVFSHAREGIVITDPAGNIQEVNASFTRITGYERDEVIGKNPHLLHSGRQGKAFYQAMWETLRQQDYWSGELWNRRKNGELYPELLTITAMRDEQQQISRYFGLFADISAMKETESKRESMVHYDVLTGLPNRALLSDRLRHAMLYAERNTKLLSVIYLDIDDFKGINDQFGTVAADQLLLTLAERMKQVMRESDTLARLGGDEFVMILSDLAEAAHSLPIIQRLFGSITPPVQLGDKQLQVSASLGVIFYPQTGKMNEEQLLRQADQAMYQAKLSGKNCFQFFNAEQDRSIRDFNERQEQIRQALKNREFVLYYQPKVNMRTGTVIGTEALIRWQHPQRGLLPPAAFLPYTEGHPLSIALGEWVIGEALAQIHQWRETGLHLPVSVNVSATQLEQQDFLAMLQHMLANYPALRAGDLELEVLESSALKNMDNVSGIIDACRKSGVHIALDDFGTGYSSLTYLRRLAADSLKIDQSFVRDMLTNPDDFIILQGVINLSHAFRRDVIAEGVETVEHGVLLLQLDCEHGQGYGIARPMPASQIPDWIKAWRPDPAWLNRQPVSDRFFPVLLASIEHRAWMHTLKKHLQNGLSSPPALDTNKCRFSNWLDNECRTFFDLRQECQRIGELHHEVHEMAEQLCASEQPEQSEALNQQQVDHLTARSKHLLEELEKLVEHSHQDQTTHETSNQIVH